MLLLYSLWENIALFWIKYWENNGCDYNDLNPINAYNCEKIKSLDLQGI